MIKFRPHHFMCTLGFQGKGYSPFFVENYQKIVEILKVDPHGLIEVVNELDSVCKACPHQNKKHCVDQPLIEKLDKTHQEILDLKENQILSWLEAKALIKQKMTLEKFHLACEDCEWKSLNVCETALKNLIQ